MKHIPRAVGSARILADAYPDNDVVAAHLVAFTNPRLPLEEIESAFSKHTAYVVGKIRDVYDQGIKLPNPGFSGEIQISFAACAIYDINETLKEWGDKPLSTTVLQVIPHPEKTVILQQSLEQHLRKFRRELEDTVFPFIENEQLGKIEQSFRTAFRNLELKIARPDPSPALANQPKTFVPKGP